MIVFEGRNRHIAEALARCGLLDSPAHAWICGTDTASLGQGLARPISVGCACGVLRLRIGAISATVCSCTFPKSASNTGNDRTHGQGSKGYFGP